MSDPNAAQLQEAAPPPPPAEAAQAKALAALAAARATAVASLKRQVIELAASAGELHAANTTLIAIVESLSDAGISLAKEQPTSATSRRWR